MKLNFDFDFTTTIIAGCFICFSGILAMFISIFVAPDSMASIAAIIASGAGLFGVGKIANTYYDTHQKNDLSNPEA